MGPEGTQRNHRRSSTKSVTCFFTSIAQFSTHSRLFGGPSHGSCSRIQGPLRVLPFGYALDSLHPLVPSDQRVQTPVDEHAEAEHLRWNCHLEEWTKVRRCDLCPPTSTIAVKPAGKQRQEKSIAYSPVLRLRELTRSASNLAAAWRSRGRLQEKGHRKRWLSLDFRQYLCIAFRTRTVGDLGMRLYRE